MRHFIQKRSSFSPQRPSREGKSHSVVHHTNPVEALQRSLGNQGVARMLRMPVQKSELSSNAATSSDQVHRLAQLGITGGGAQLPHTETIQRSFGRHYVSNIRAHVGADAAAASHAIGASAYTTGEKVAFDSPPNLYTAAHEAAHVVQQRSGVNLPGDVGRPGDSYEQNADAVAERVVQGHSAEPLLNRYSGSSAGTRSVQRFAFVNETQIKKPEKDFTSTMKSWLGDSTIRNYTDVAEFKKHSEKKTDYLGNLKKDGTWLRFNPTGINLLGEKHTEVVLEDVVPVVGSKSFIHEQLAADVLPAGSNVKGVYEAENKDLFKQLGVEKEKNKEEFGAESLFPKIGFAMNAAIPYFDGREPVTDLQAAGYFGKPVQRYLKIAWAYSKDNKLMVQQKQKGKEKIPPKLEALAAVHTKVEGQIDKFITSLVVDGFIGDQLVKKQNAALLAPLAEFATALSEAMVELATTEKSSRLSDAGRKQLAAAKSTSEPVREKLFFAWRDFLFEDNVKAATARGVRYAGMGQAHLDNLIQVGLTKDQHPFEMAGKDITAFRDLTAKLKKTVKK